MPNIGESKGNTRRTTALMLCCTVLAFTHLASAKQPLFANSIVSTDFDFIQTNDASAFKSLRSIGRETKELPGTDDDRLLFENTYVFRVQFKDDVRTEIWAHPDFKTTKDAEEVAALVAEGLGKLPRFMRQKLDHVVINTGDRVGFGEHEGHLFVLSSGNIHQRVLTHDLEETIFHEACHATLEQDHARHPNWVKAQKKDRAFITDYAAQNPSVEDLPESALFAYTLLTFPGRLPFDLEQAVRDQIPHRLDYFEKLFNNSIP